MPKPRVWCQSRRYSKPATAAEQWQHGSLYGRAVVVGYRGAWWEAPGIDQLDQVSPGARRLVQTPRVLSVGLGVEEDDPRTGFCAELRCVLGPCFCTGSGMSRRPSQSPSVRPAAPRPSPLSPLLAYQPPILTLATTAPAVGLPIRGKSSPAALSSPDSTSELLGPSLPWPTSPSWPPPPANGATNDGTNAGGFQRQLPTQLPT